MDDRPLSILHYLPVSPRDEQWGIVCTTAGHQHVPPGTPYPVSEHPEHYLFYKGSGRTLDEYQLVYITAGRGRFESASCPSQTVEAGTMLLLFPNEWHSYSPDPGTGWTEWWVGFRGANIDRLEQQGFLCRRRPLLRIGCSGGIERCYREIIGTVEEERVGFQPLISSIVLHILGSVLFDADPQDVEHDARNERLESHAPPRPCRDDLAVTPLDAAAAPDPQQGRRRQGTPAVPAGRHWRRGTNPPLRPSGRVQGE